MSESNQSTSKLQSIWKSRDDKNFYKWIRSFADAVNEYDFTLERLAREIGANPAEVEAAIQLSMLGDVELKLVSENPPPKTTWFIFAHMSLEEIKVAIEAIKNRLPGQTPSSVLSNSLINLDVTSQIDEVKKMSVEIFKHLSARAKRYSLLKNNERSALFSFAKARESGRVLSDKQAAWAISMIETLVQGGALITSSDEPNSDVKICEDVLKLFPKLIK